MPQAGHWIVIRFRGREALLLLLLWLLVGWRTRYSKVRFLVGEVKRWEPWERGWFILVWLCCIWLLFYLEKCYGVMECYKIRMQGEVEVSLDISYIQIRARINARDSPRYIK